MMSGSDRRVYKEYGGFLPLELNPGNEYFVDYSERMMRFNSFKAALCFLLNKVKCKKIWIPYYYCPTTINAIENCNIDVEFYHIDEDFLPRTIGDETDCAIMLVDYFGVNQIAVREMLNKIKKAKVIIDNAHAFFSAPVMHKNIYNIYSAKKFFGVPDGAYLISSDLTAVADYATSCSMQYVDYLVKTYELGTNASYQGKKNADKYIAQHYAPMSKLALGLLQNVDYDRVKEVRLENYKYMKDAFIELNALSLGNDNIPYLFPLLLPEKGRNLKRKLIEKKIYVPTLWNVEQYAEIINDFESCMAWDTLFLPIDQRYNKNDMEYLADCVTRLL